MATAKKTDTDKPKKARASRTTKPKSSKKSEPPVEEVEYVSESLFGEPVVTSTEEEKEPLKTDIPSEYKRAPIINDIYDNMFTNKEYFDNLTKSTKESFVFPVNQRMAIKYPEQAQYLNVKNTCVSSYIIDFWVAIHHRMGYKPKWLFTKGAASAKKSKDEKDTIKIKEPVFRSYLDFYGISTRDGEYIKSAFREELSKELKTHEEYLNALKDAQEQ